ncbi:MAG: M24 family metallopeptidase [Desulfobacterales bacterium]|nr:aminopeptidase P N-terminal domain-containing protein [Deltaproteobacteria bacterium]NNL77484.1 M24 family metallopeptidase [Desulfobacterales bacterium]
MKYLPIDRDLFIQNRKRFVEQLKAKSITVFNSNDILPTSADGTHPFIQQTDLFYLSGIDQEESTLVICPDAKEEKHREILFVKETNEQIALWEGKKYTQEDATSVSGIKTIYWNHEFNDIFKTLAFQSDNIYLNTNEHLRAVTRVETRDGRFLKWCRRSFPLHNYERLAPIMHALRAVKSSLEVELIEKACSITDKAFRRLLGFIKPGVWEFDIEAEIYHEFLRNRSRGPAFETIVASGVDSCTLHYVKNDKQCQDGDLVLMDFGAEYANYAADLTRTVPVNGRFSKRQREVYHAVLNVQKAATRLLKPGKTLDEYTTEVGKIMETELIGLGLLDTDEVKKQSEDQPLYKKYFPHGTSHHLGLDVHDYGDRHRKFEPGMVFTCEPGIYIRDEAIGIRIENDILITEDEPLDLTAGIPREADEIEELMNQ